MKGEGQQRTSAVRGVYRMEGSSVDVCKVIVMQIMGWDRASACTDGNSLIKCGAADTIMLQLENTLYMHGICKLHTLKGNGLLSSW